MSSSSCQIQIGEHALTVEDIPGGRVVSCPAWRFEMLRDGRYRLWPPVSFTARLVEMIAEGTVSFQNAGKAYDYWREERLPAVLKGLTVIGLLVNKNA